MTKRQGGRTDLTSTQNEGRLTTSEKLAGTYGVSRATIERDGQFAQAVDTLWFVSEGPCLTRGSMRVLCFEGFWLRGSLGGEETVSLRFDSRRLQGPASGLVCRT